MFQKIILNDHLLHIYKQIYIEQVKEKNLIFPKINYQQLFLLYILPLKQLFQKSRQIVVQKSYYNYNILVSYLPRLWIYYYLCKIKNISLIQMKLLKLLYIQTFMTNPQHPKHYKKTLLHILSFPRLMKKQLKLKNIFSNSFFKLQNTIIYFESLYCPLFHNYLHLLYKGLSIPFLNIYIVIIYMNVFYINLISFF